MYFPYFFWDCIQVSVHQFVFVFSCLVFWMYLFGLATCGSCSKRPHGTALVAAPVVWLAHLLSRLMPNNRSLKLPPLPSKHKQTNLDPAGPTCVIWLQISSCLSFGGYDMKVLKSSGNHNGKGKIAIDVLGVFSNCVCAWSWIEASWSLSIYQFECCNLFG